MKQIFRWIKNLIFQRLQFTTLWPLVGLVASLHQSIKHRSLVRIFKDKDGDWINRRNNLVIASTDLNVASLKDIEDRAADLWFYHYQPKLGDVIIDVGAGIGDDVVVFSKIVGNNGKVIAIEAHPETFRCMVKTIRLNNLQNVIALNVGCCDEEMLLKISSEENHLSNRILSTKDEFEETTNVYEVRGTTIDQLIHEQEIGKVDFLKMNIEGAETAALKGAETILNNDLQFVISCHDFKADRDEGENFRTLEDVSSFLGRHQKMTSVRENDPRCEIRYFVYSC